MQEWEVRPSVRLARQDLEYRSVADKLSAWFKRDEAAYAVAVDLGPDETAKAVGGTFAIQADTPGKAVDRALEILATACSEVGIELGPVVEIEIEPGE